MLREMGFEFVMMSADIDEKAIRLADPRQLTLALAQAKADVLLKRIKEPAILITSDQVCVWNGTVIEKPESVEEARKFLHGYNQFPVKTVGAVVVVNSQTGQRAEGVSEVLVHFKPMSDGVIEDMVADPRILNWVGGFSVLDCQQRQVLKQVEGPIDAVVGLDKELTRRLIQKVQS